MPEDVKIAKLSASISGGENGASYSPEGLRCEMEVNSFPVVTAVVNYPDGDDVSVQAPVSGEILSRIGGLQTLRLEGRSEPDFLVTAEDGLGGSLSYDGYISSPILELTRVSTANKIASVGEAAMLDALDLNIYRTGYLKRRTETAANAGLQLDPVPSADSGDVTQILKEITEAMVGNFDRVLNGEPLQISKDILQLQHDINENGPLDIWYEILGANPVVFQQWDKLLSLHPTIGIQLAINVRDLLETPTPGFWNKVRSLMSAFQMFYVPSFDGLGKFVRNDEKVADAEETLELSVSGFTVTDGSTKILPPGGVVMSGRATPARRTETDVNNPLVPRILAYAPDPLLQGFIQRENVPFWLLRESGIPILGSEIDGGGGDGSLNLSLPARKARREKGIEFKEKVDEATQGVMTELCEVIFKEMQLAHSQVSVTVPLDFTLNDSVGKRVKVKIKAKEDDEAGEFEAFVKGIVHDVDLRQGKQLNSSTALTLTHAKYS